MKIYTRTGDKGETRLFGGQCVPKDHPSIMSYGALDELNSHIGLIVSNLRTDHSGNTEINSHITFLEEIQSNLFSIGTHLATPYYEGEAPDTIPALTDEIVTQLEQQIDTLTKPLPELKNFILPGGTVAASQTQVARAICRRCERHVVTLQSTEYVHPVIIQYINRLSDYLFTLSRWLNFTANTQETIWTNN